jgi:hypothetical protein
MVGATALHGVFPPVVYNVSAVLRNNYVFDSVFNISHVLFVMGTIAALFFLLLRLFIYLVDTCCTRLAMLHRLAPVCVSELTT